jgi:hypothetical protein
LIDSGNNLNDYVSMEVVVGGEWRGKVMDEKEFEDFFGF